MSSRPPPPPQPQYSSAAASPASLMTETQYPPSPGPYALPPPSSIVQRSLGPSPFPPHLPSLSIPPPPKRIDYWTSPSYHPHVSSAPQYRPERWPSAPIDKLLSKPDYRPVPSRYQLAKDSPKPHLSPQSISQTHSNNPPDDSKR